MRRPLTVAAVPAVVVLVAIAGLASGSRLGSGRGRSDAVRGSKGPSSGRAPACLPAALIPELGGAARRHSLTPATNSPTVVSSTLDPRRAGGGSRLIRHPERRQRALPAE
jgi:hypothetical protein